MHALLDRLQACIAARFPGMAASLDPGAGEAAIDAVEDAIGRALPSSVRALYRWHDGQADDAHGYVTGLFCGMPFLRLDAALAHWRSATAGEGADAAAYACLPPATIGQRAASTAWIPLAHDGGGAFLGIDLDPDSAGSVGQVISFGAREFVRVQAGASLEQFLERLLDLYEKGDYALVEEEEGEFSLSTLAPATGHFLDYLRLKAQAGQ